MDRILLSGLLAILSFSVNAQVKFDSGYFVNNDGRKTICLIKNYDWKYNPNDFLYKQAENADVQKADINDVREFGIVNFSRYERYDVDIDTSSEELDEVSTNSRPEFKRKRVFLKVIVEGKASLYEYWAENRVRYFFKTDSLTPEPLIHKKYYGDDEPTNLLENNLFRNQLWTSLQAPDLAQKDFSNLNYNEKSLAGIFDRYNKVQHATTENFSKKRNEKRFNLNLRLGASLSSLTVEETQSGGGDSKTPLGSKISAMAGLEAEFIMGFDRNKWALVFGSTYGSYKSTPAADGGSVSADYKMIELSAGVREYFFLGKGSKLFATAMGIFNIPFGSSTATYQNFSLDYTEKQGAALSFGYKYKNKCSVELKYNFSRSILDYYLYLNGPFHTTSLVFAYTLF